MRKFFGQGIRLGERLKCLPGVLIQILRRRSVGEIPDEMIVLGNLYILRHSNIELRFSSERHVWSGTFLVK